MYNMSPWDIVLLAGAGYLALVSLAQLMRRRRITILDEIRVHAEAERRRQHHEQLKQERQKQRGQTRNQAA